MQIYFSDSKTGSVFFFFFFHQKGFDSKIKAYTTSVCESQCARSR